MNRFNIPEFQLELLYISYISPFAVGRIFNTVRNHNNTPATHSQMCSVVPYIVLCVFIDMRLTADLAKWISKRQTCVGCRKRPAKTIKKYIVCITQLEIKRW